MVDYAYAPLRRSRFELWVTALLLVVAVASLLLNPLALSPPPAGELHRSAWVKYK